MQILVGMHFIHLKLSDSGIQEFSHLTDVIQTAHLCNIKYSYVSEGEESDRDRDGEASCG